MTTLTTIPAQRDDEADVGRETWPLVAAAQAGDAEAFGELYRRYEHKVHTFVSWRLGGGNGWAGRRETAEDITAAVFTRAFARIRTVEYRGRDIGAWFTTIARNLVADHYKAASTRLSQPVDIADVLDHHEQGDPSTDPLVGVVMKRELREDIEAALATLTPEQATVVRLRFLRELSVDETRLAMGLSEGAVKALQSRAVARLRKSTRLAAHR